MVADPPIANPQVAAVFAAYPSTVRQRLLLIRRMIFEVAADTPAVGELHETLKWGQPSYLTLQSKSGSLIRVDQIKSKSHASGTCAVYFHCQTTLVDSFKEIYGDTFTFIGNRCITFAVNAALPDAPLRDCIAMALTYHLNKKTLHRTPARTGRQTIAVQPT